jgi:hypothetical protein
MTESPSLIGLLERVIEALDVVGSKLLRLGIWLEDKADELEKRNSASE